MEEQIINEEILREEIIDWKTLEKKEELETNEINESKKMLRKIQYILECTKDIPQGIKKEQKTLDEYIEEWKEEDPRLEKNLDDNHCGSIKYKFYKYLYQIRQGNTIKLESTKKEVTEKNYEEIYEKDTELKNKIEEENGTQIQFLSNKQEQEKNETIYELNKSLEKTDDTSKNSFKIGEGQNAPNQQNESFFQKTKRWAGTAWSYINIANYFPKTEYKEYRNANGDWVKIPKKKIPLKKKKVEETDEEHIINKTFDRDRENLTFMTLDKIPIPNFG